MSSETPVTPPFGPPDCPWREVSAISSIPETAVYKDGKLDGDKVYIGRVNDGNAIYIGTAIPQKGICCYIDKNSQLKTSAKYEILTVDCGDPLVFQDMDLDNRNILVAGIDDTGEILYVGCVEDGGNTYYGWASKASKSVHIPRDAGLGPQVLEKGFGVLIHKFLDRLCICPPCPGPCPPKTA